MSTEKKTAIETMLSRLKYAKNFNTWKDVALYLGEGEATISIWRKRNSPSAREKILYRVKGDVHDVFLLTGEGPMLESTGPNGEALTAEARTEKRTAEVVAAEPSNVSPAPRPRIAPRMIPVVSWVQAGDFIDSQAQTTPGYADDWVETFETASQNAFALVVHGDSMEPEFRDGDIITVDPERQAENGSYVIVKNGVEATFKQLVWDGSSVFLKPLNDRYPIRDMTGTEVRIVGVVVEKRKRYR